MTWPRGIVLRPDCGGWEYGVSAEAAAAWVDAHDVGWRARACILPAGHTGQCTHDGVHSFQARVGNSEHGLASTTGGGGGTMRCGAALVVGSQGYFCEQVHMHAGEHSYLSHRWVGPIATAVTLRVGEPSDEFREGDRVVVRRAVWDDIRGGGIASFLIPEDVWPQGPEPPPVTLRSGIVEEVRGGDVVVTTNYRLGPEVAAASRHHAVLQWCRSLVVPLASEAVRRWEQDDDDFGTRLALGGPGR